MTVEPTKQTKGAVAFDMGWRTALLGIICFGFCLLATVLTARRVLTGAPVELRISWRTVFVLLASAWFAFKVQVRMAQFAFGLLTLSFGSRIVLAVAQASAQTQILNAEIMRFVDFLIMTGLCLYVADWFRRRVNRS
jgi:hypothetical protein